MSPLIVLFEFQLLAYFLVETCDAKGQRSCANTCAQEGLALQRKRAAQISELRSGIKPLGSNDEESCIYLDLIYIYIDTQMYAGHLDAYSDYSQGFSL